ncbi:hypothetical protein [Treponema phagedenis]|uniref:Uncharacterized protein n=1 Tax=Treponema phagedenis TaxID=162 RepID=A0AAE6IVM1_TREPH|nr:hypothetical protein [Treponema phagedenis]NVP23799.1 hypothetical protein [Treponema phagedenis]QEJ93780.1 hypothetical protein FUT79_00150 [Treponema phagedenis]QEJ99154.1 hypothetical protein FUT82_14905 [Treponema phagedenis]QEK07223.1 hypothetical protein FUT80_11195 [Treponema phagedenis]QKS91150.1 hypothetical protein HPJ96_00155 [Treponema phagedenis]
MIETKALTEKLGLNKETAKRIKSLEQGLIKVLTEATLKAFKIGEILYMVEANNSKGRQAFVDWVTKDLKISWQTCLNYKKLFVFFYQDPERLENLTIMQAYAEAGIAVKKALPPPKEEYEEVFTAGEEEEAYDAELAEIFKRNPLSGIQLKKYRVNVEDGTVWGFRKGYGRISIADIRLTKPAGLPELEWLTMQNEVQIVFEKYFEKIERCEDEGVIPEPEDTPFGLKHIGRR